jgi:hypothetical protein
MKTMENDDDDHDDKLNHLQVIGPLSNDTSLIFGEPNYSIDLDPSLIVTPLQGLTQLGNTVTHANGCSDVGCKSYESDDVKLAVENSDIVFVCLGTGRGFKG